MRARTPAGPRVNVVVTDEIIQAAVPRDSQHCIFADALKASFPDAKAVSVDLATIRFTDPRRGLRYTYLTPRSVQVELVKFDQGLPTRPFEFQLRSAHVTRSGSNKTKRAAVSERQKKANRLSVEKARGARPLAKQAIVPRKNTGGYVPDRVGGKAPPLQVDAETKIPFSRRRAFGLRGLAL